MRCHIAALATYSPFASANFCSFCIIKSNANLYTLRAPISILRLLQQQLRRCQSARQRRQADSTRGAHCISLQLLPLLLLLATVGEVNTKESRVMFFVFPFPCLPFSLSPTRRCTWLARTAGSSGKQCASRGACLTGFIKWCGSLSDQQSRQSVKHLH